MPTETTVIQPSARLKSFEQITSNSDTSSLLVSVVIPTLNEADNIAETIRRTREAGDCEIIVVDGGSTDETVANASKADVIAVTTPGRAHQQNHGANLSHGNVLLFLHSDCWLEPGSIDAVISLMNQKPDVVAGCFTQCIEDPGVIYRLLEWGNSRRVRWGNWAYGDQGIFIRRDVFDEIGQFPAIDLMEDLFLMKRLKGAGEFIELPEKIHVSPRRWKKAGPLQQTLWNWFMITSVHCGVSPNRFAKSYPQVR